MWFTEDAWSPIIGLVACGVLFGVVFVLTQRDKWLYPLPVLLIAAVAVYFVEKRIVTPREQVATELSGLIESFVEETQAMTKTKEPKCLKYFSEHNKRDRTRVIAAILLVHIEDQRLTDVRTQLTNQETRAITHFRANGTVSTGGAGGHYATRWELTWQLEGGAWKVVSTRMLDPVSGQEHPIPRVD